MALVGSCGEDDPAARSPATSTTAAATPTRRVDRSVLERPVVVEAVCANWRPNDRDSQTVNEYVADLLLPHTFVPGQPPELTTDRIDVVIATACRDHRVEPDQFVAAVMAGLAISEEKLDERVEAACRRYERQRRAVAAGNWSGDDVDAFVRNIAGAYGVSLPMLRGAIGAICGP